MCGKICFAKTAVEPKCKACLTLHKRANNKFKDSKEYRRDWALRKKYGISSEEFDTLWIISQAKCGICSVQLAMPEQSRGQPLTSACVDHDHTTGNIRGLLCNGCNKGLGLFKDSKSILTNAINWLGEHNE